MSRPKRSLEVFSLSALDLFASAMGSFIIITLIIFPYYSKTAGAEDTFDQLEDLRAEIEAIAEESEAYAEEAEAKATGAKQSAPTTAELATLEDEVAQLKSKTEDQLARLDGLAAEFERGMPFSILGIETQAKRFVFLIDMSGSMKKYTKIMEQTLLRAINPFDENTEVSMIGFGTYRSAVRLSYWPETRDFAAMSPDAKRAAGDYISDIIQDFSGTTPTFTALKAAFDMSPDVIVLLSDGKPQGEGMQWPDVVAETERLNLRKIKIHTVALGDYTDQPDLIAFLRDIASGSGGSFIGIDR